MASKDRLTRLETVVESLAASVVHHDDQIDKLIQVAHLQQKQLDKLRKESRSLDRRWEAYLNRLPPQ